MKRHRSGYAAWALLAFGLTVAGAHTANAQYFTPQFVPAQPAAFEPMPSVANSYEPTPYEPTPFAPNSYEPQAADPERAQLVSAEQQASGGARRVLSAARTMIDNAVAIRGSCATWLNAVYRQAGGRFSTVFNGDRRGRFADRSLLQPGDWVQFVNHSYGNVGHSAIFVGWADADRTVALTVSHPGQQRNEPGRFREYEFTSVYRIDRMRD